MHNSNESIRGKGSETPSAPNPWEELAGEAPPTTQEEVDKLDIELEAAIRHARETGDVEPLNEVIERQKELETRQRQQNKN